MAPKKIIIDTDPGVDDVLAILLALSAEKEELEVLLISVCFGNIDVGCCLRNAVSMFYVLELERHWRISNGFAPGFAALEACKPVVAVGADRPLENVPMEYDYFHGQDGLGGIHSSAPHFTPTEQWTHLFSPEADPANTSPPMVRLPPNFKPSSRPAHIEILASLAAHPPDTIIIIALGPLTNLALAASSDPTTFLRAKEIVTMGGALMVPGNVTPVAEFNWFACPYSAARILALTSPIPESTMPACRELPPYPAASLLPRTLNITQISLDITTEHLLQLDEFNMAVGVKSDSGSPLSTWANGFLDASFKRLESIYGGGRSKDVLLALHDPLCVWYVLQGGSDAGWKVVEGCDVRVETDGQWTRGMAVVDRRKKRVADAEAAELLKHDRGGWLHRGRGNRVRIVTGSNGQEVNFGKIMVKRIFNCMQFQEEE